MSGPGDLDAEIWRNRDRRIRELTPAQVPDRGPGERPQFYIIGGQQAAGKTTTQKRLHRMLDPASVAFYDGDDNEKIHPHYKEIMRAHGRGGTMEMINRLGREHNYHAEYLSHLTGAYGGPKYDVIASQPLGREEGADWWLNGFQNQGYETTAVFVATHESNSRLGIAHRYQQDRDDPKKLYGRWVPLEFHDGAYQNNPNVAHHLESQSKVDHLFVVNRDGQVLHENHRGPDGTMVNELGARDDEGECGAATAGRVDEVAGENDPAEADHRSEGQGEDVRSAQDLDETRTGVGHGGGSQGGRACVGGHMCGGQENT